MSRLTCLTCQVGFTDADLHRTHFKSDWHRYNLKRKVADLPSVSVEVFDSRKEAHEAETREVKEPGNYCVACRKHFGSGKAYGDHIKSKKHLEMILKFDGDKTNVQRVSESREERLGNKKGGGPSSKVDDEDANDNDDDDDDEMEVEEVDSDEWDEFDDDPIPVTDCIFCSHHSANMDNNLRHLTEAHSFFIPDPEFLTDTAGLLEYLGAKVGQGHMCVWCNDRCKSYQTVDAVQKHMVDKGHCKMLHEGDALVEYDEFYDYSSSYPEGGDPVDNPVEVDKIDDSGYTLVLPSGATVGHRSLARYFRQSLNPNRQLVAARTGREGGAGLVSTYRKLGWTGTTGADAKRKAKDIRFIKNMQSKKFMFLGVKANRLQHHYREQNPM